MVMLMKLQEELWWKVIKLQVEQCSVLIGMKSKEKIIKERIDQVHQMVKNGENGLEKMRNSLAKEKFVLFFQGLQSALTYFI